MLTIALHRVSRSTRFAVLVVMLPLALAAATFIPPGDSNADEWAAGVSFVTLVVVTQTLTLCAIERFRSDRQRRAPLPLAVAAGGSAATVALRTVDPTLPAWVRIATAALAGALAACAARALVVRLVEPVTPPPSSSPAPAGAIRRRIETDRTAVWTGQAPGQPRRVIERWMAFYAVLGTAILAFALQAGSQATVLFLVGGISLSQLILVPAKYRAARVRVAAGPAGLTVRSGLTRSMYFSSPIEHIDSAWYTDAPNPNLTTSWGKKSETKRLAYLTRGGAALLVRFTDGTDLVVSMDDPAEPASVINGLLDRRPNLVSNPGISAC